MDTAIPTHIPLGISPRELAARIGAPGAPLLLDVRRPARFAESTHLLATAQWCAPDAVAAWARSQPPREVAVYCVHGHEVSQQAADTLRQAGWDARFLAGGLQAVDTDRLDLAPPAAGLLAVLPGLSDLHAHDDPAMLEAAMPFCDALYAWCRIEARGVTERHQWKPDTVKGPSHE